MPVRPVPVLALALALVVALSAPAFARAEVVPERVRFGSLDRDGGLPLAIDGLLLVPESAPPAGGRPAVVALHGCGGMYSAAIGRERQLSERHAAWARAFVDEGYAVLFPDSFGPRGRREICTVPMRERSVSAFQRRLDALGAHAWLAQQADVDPARIALVGWSHGGSTVLAAVNAGDARVDAVRSGQTPFFRTAIAFYPGCSAPLRDARWRPAAPLAVLIGSADDWTPAAPCEALAERARARDWPLELTVYDGAYHGFDAPSGKVRVRKDVPNGTVPGAGVHVGPDPKARDDAWQRVRARLREALAPAGAHDRPGGARAPERAGAEGRS